MDVARDETGHGVRERVGTIVGSTGLVPTALWSPIDGPVHRLIMVGHGASGSKFQGYVVSLARSLAREHGCAVVAIDGPVHGERSGRENDSETVAFLQFAERWSSDEGLTDHMVQDWRAVLDDLGGLDSMGRVRVGYWGLSMGTIFGLPLVAADARIEACVLGLMGTTGPSRDRLTTDAAAIRVPTMFLLQWDDELISREAGLDLFDRLATTDKTLIATPGRHAQVTSENFRRSAAFLVQRLDAPGDVQK